MPCWGLPAGTELELTPPPPLVEDAASGQDANRNRMAALNPTLVEAEQGVEKARAASRPSHSSV